MSRLAGAGLVVPISHCLPLPQIQPDGVTLKYNDYAWNKVWAQALQPLWLWGEGGPEPVSPALWTEPCPTCPPLESAVELGWNVSPPAQPWGRPSTCGCPQQPSVLPSQGWGFSLGLQLLCRPCRLPMCSTWSPLLASASPTPRTRSTPQTTPRRVTWAAGRDLPPACPCLGAGGPALLPDPRLLLPAGRSQQLPGAEGFPPALPRVLQERSLPHRGELWGGLHPHTGRVGDAGP